jgi:hypothetical protein
VAEGNTAEEVHLGYAKDVAGGDHARTAKPGTRTEGQGDTEDRTKTAKKPSTPPTDVATTTRTAVKQKDATKLEEEDDEEEIPGHIKSFDAEKRLLVVTLLNNKSRSFILARHVPVHVKGAAVASRQGLKDPQLKVGAFITVVTDEGGRKVKELKITPASEVRRRKAG